MVKVILPLVHDIARSQPKTDRQTGVGDVFEDPVLIWFSRTKSRSTLLYNLTDFGVESKDKFEI